MGTKNIDVSGVSASDETGNETVEVRAVFTEGHDVDGDETYSNANVDDNYQLQKRIVSCIDSQTFRLILSPECND